MKYKRYSGALDEQEAYEHHAKRYGGVHTFYIRNIQEYVKLKPIIAMFGTRVKIIAKGKLQEYKDAIKEKSVAHKAYVPFKAPILNKAKVNNKGANRDLRKLDLMYGRKI